MPQFKRQMHPSGQDFESWMRDVNYWQLKNGYNPSDPARVLLSGEYRRMYAAGLSAKDAVERSK